MWADLVVFDEYHFGAWRETAKELFEGEEAQRIVDFVDANLRAAQEERPAPKPVPVITGVRDTES